MRETLLTRDGDRRVLRTDDRGTTLLDAAGAVAAEHGNDLHEALLERHRAEGWRVEADGHRPPSAAGGLPPGAREAGARGDPTATVTDGEDA
jgi:hypothetical protein